MEEGVFHDPAVAGELAKMVEARLHNDAEVKGIVRPLQMRLVNSIAAPIYLIMDPRTEKILARQDGAMLDEHKFATWLREAVK